MKPETRPNQLNGITIKTKTGYGTLYLTINEMNEKPFEVFALIGKPGTSVTAKTEAIGRLVSLILRSGIDVKEVIKQLKGIEGENSTYDGKNLIRSIPDAIAQVLERLYITEKLTQEEEVTDA